MLDWYDREVLENPLSDYVLFSFVIALAFFLYYVTIKLLKSRWLKRMTKDQPTLAESLPALTRTPLKVVLTTAVVYWFSALFDLPDRVQAWVQGALLGLVAFSLSYLLIRATDAFFTFLQSTAKRTQSRLDDQLYPQLRKAAKAFIALVTILLIIQNWGYNISALLTGLGIGGLAVALAAQDTLSNLFGAITLFVDRPFHVGETVSVEGYTGDIENVGLRSTRIRTFDGTLVTLPNSAVAKAIIENLTNRPTRRTHFTIGVTYDTSYEKLQQAVSILRQILASHPATAQYRAYFNRYGESSLNLLVEHWCSRLDYEEYLKCLEEINFEIKRSFEGAGIDMAFPTQTVYLRSEKPLLVRRDAP